MEGHVSLDEMAAAAGIVFMITGSIAPLCLVGQKIWRRISDWFFADIFGLG